MTKDEIVAAMQSEMTREQAIALADTQWWDVVGMAEAALLQLNQPKFAMPSFSLFRESVEFLLGRPVLTHEFTAPHLLIREAAEGHSPSIAEILSLIPADKLMVVEGPND